MVLAGISGVPYEGVRDISGVPCEGVRDLLRLQIVGLCVSVWSFLSVCRSLLPVCIFLA